MERVIKETLTTATNLYPSLNRLVIRTRKINRNIKMTVYKTVFIPILVYLSESWIEEAIACSYRDEIFKES